MVNINSALMSMGAYLGSPTLGGGYSPTSNLGWMPGLTGQTAFSFGSTPDDSLGSLLGNQLPSRSFLRFGSADNYRLGGPGASAPSNILDGPGASVPFLSLNLPQLATPVFGQQQAAPPPQMIGGQINVNATGEAEDAHGAHGKADTSIPEDVRKQAEKKLTGRGYSEDEAKTVMDAAWEAAGMDQKKFGEIMSSPPPTKPVGRDGAEPTDADKEKWAREYAEWFAKNVGNVPDGDRAGFVSEAIDAPGVATGTVQVKSAKPSQGETPGQGVRKFEIEGGNRKDRYASGQPLYLKDGKWYLKPNGTDDAEATGDPPRAGKKITTLKIGGRELKLTPGNLASGVQNYTVDGAFTGPPKFNNGERISHNTGNNNWIRIGNNTSSPISELNGKSPTPKTVGGSSTSTLTIGGGDAKLQPDLTEVGPLTERLEEAVKARREAEKKKEVGEKDERSRAVKTAREAIRDAIGATDATLKFKDDGKILALTSDKKSAGAFAETIKAPMVRARLDNALGLVPQGTSVTLDGKPLGISTGAAPAPAASPTTEAAAKAAIEKLDSLAAAGIPQRTQYGVPREAAGQAMRAELVMAKRAMEDKKFDKVALHARAAELWQRAAYPAEGSDQKVLSAAAYLASQAAKASYAPDALGTALVPPEKRALNAAYNAAVAAGVIKDSSQTKPTGGKTYADWAKMEAEQIASPPPQAPAVAPPRVSRGYRRRMQVPAVPPAAAPAAPPPAAAAPPAAPAAPQSQERGAPRRAEKHGLLGRAWNRIISWF